PVLVGPRVPGAVPVVDGHRVADAVLVDRPLDVRDDVLERELRRVHADDDEAVAVVAGVPGLQVGQRADAVHARVGPEVDEDDLAAQLAQRQRARAGRVYPLRDLREVRGGAVVAQGVGRAPGGDRRGRVGGGGGQMAQVAGDAVRALDLLD